MRKSLLGESRPIMASPLRLPEELSGLLRILAGGELGGVERTKGAFPLSFGTAGVE